MPAFLFSQDSSRSPEVEKIEIASENININGVNLIVMFDFSKNNIVINVIITKIYPPKKPSQLFFGLNFGANLFFPNKLPNM